MPRISTNRVSFGTLMQNVRRLFPTLNTQLVIILQALQSIVLQEQNQRGSSLDMELPVTRQQFDIETRFDVVVTIEVHATCPSSGESQAVVTLKYPFGFSLVLNFGLQSTFLWWLQSYEINQEAKFAYLGIPMEVGRFQEWIKQYEVK